MLCPGLHAPCVVRYRALTLAALFVFFALISPLSAQISSATMTGTITDPQGAAIPSVKVLVVETNTNFQARSETNAEGLFRIQSLQPGNYDVTFEAAGFKTLVQRGLQLKV